MTSTFAQHFQHYLKSNGFDSDSFSKKSKISESKVKRWLNGVSLPNEIELKKLIKFNIPGIDFIKSEKAKSDPSGNLELSIGTYLESYSLAPYVINGPANQRDFHEQMIGMQIQDKKNCRKSEYARRLSMLESANGIETDQFKLEKPKSSAKHWNSNYSTHGFHRYVGRFPPHLVRSLINNFGLEKGSTLLEPFSGSGTTLVEARLMGLNAIGVEICPLSAMISRVKAKFPQNVDSLRKLPEEYSEFYEKKWTNLYHKKLTHKDVLARNGNHVPEFANLEKWFTVEAFLGVSITVEYLWTKKGYTRELTACALSSAMRSIGNIDVDVVRAEYSKAPRKNVLVGKLVTSKLRKFIKDIALTNQITADIQSSPKNINVILGSILEADIKPSSVDAIITSPPYGVEALSYLRTHLLSYRSLAEILKYDPYSDSQKIIGSEYLPKETQELWESSSSSKTFEHFFKALLDSGLQAKHISRAHMMMKFFDEMNLLSTLFCKWLKPKGKIAFVIGNKKIDEQVIPTEKIICELFASNGLTKVGELKHKLKTNNSNSEVPWQENIIQDEFVLIFEKKR